MTTKDSTTMGDLIRFPDRQRSSGQPTADGATAPAARPVVDAHDPSGQQHAEPGAELVVDRERTVVPAALAGPAAKAYRHVREHGWGYTTTSAKFLARHSYYLLGGAWDTASGTYRRWTGRDIDAQIAAAKAAGEHGVAADLLRQRTEDRKLLLERLRVWGRFLVTLPAALGGLCALVLGLTLVVSVAALVNPGGAGFVEVWSGLFSAAVSGFEWTVWALTVPVPLLLLATATGLVVQGYNGRRRRNAAPEWAAPQTTRVGVDEVTVTADRLITALRNCGIPELRNAIKEGETTGLVDLISQFGPGVRTTITLPRGIPASKLAEKADSLASSLARGQHEVSISRSPSNESQAELWVARPGALDEPVPVSPMMDPDYGPVDLYKNPVPWGHSPQGEPIELDLIQRHILIAGLSKQGKTASARALALHASLDPSVELRIADLKGVGDWSMFADLATTLIEGAGEDNELATADMVEAATVEMDRRLAARRAKGAKGDITAAEAHDASGDHHPLIVIVDEVQIAYMSQAAEIDYDSDGNPKQGKRVVGGQTNNSRLWLAAKKLHDQGRAVNVHLWQFAQNPTDRNLPAIVREGAHVRGSLYVSNPAISRKGLGDAPVDAGAAPHRLRSEIDAGTVVTAGAPEIVKVKGEMANTVRTHYIDTEAAHTIAERAKALRTGTPHQTDAPEDRDLLADVAHAMGDEKAMRAKLVTEKLRSLAPHHPAYTDLTAEGLTTALAALDVPVRSKDGYPTVRAQRVHAALAERDDEPD